MCYVFYLLMHLPALVYHPVICLPEGSCPLPRETLASGVIRLDCLRQVRDLSQRSRKEISFPGQEWVCLLGSPCGTPDRMLRTCQPTPSCDRNGGEDGLGVRPLPSARHQSRQTLDLLKTLVTGWGGLPFKMQLLLAPVREGLVQISCDF